MSGESLKQIRHNGVEKDSDKGQIGLQGQPQNTDQRYLKLPNDTQLALSQNSLSQKVLNDANKGPEAANLKMEISDVPTQSIFSYKMTQQQAIPQLQDKDKISDQNFEKSSPTAGNSKEIIKKKEFYKHNTIGAAFDEKIDKKQTKMVPSLIFEDLETNNPVAKQYTRKNIQDPQIIINSENSERGGGNQEIDQEIDRLKLLNQRFNQIPSERNLPLNQNIDFNSDQSRLTDRQVVGAMSQIPSTYLLNSQISQQPFKIPDILNTVQGDQKNSSISNVKIDKRYQERLNVEGSNIGNSQMSLLSGIKDSTNQNDSSFNSNPQNTNTVNRQEISLGKLQQSSNIRGRKQFDQLKIPGSSPQHSQKSGISPSAQEREYSQISNFSNSRDHNKQRRESGSQSSSSNKNKSQPSQTINNNKMASMKAAANDNPSDNSSTIAKIGGEQKIVGTMKSKYSSSQMQHSELQQSKGVFARGKLPQPSHSSANVFIPFGASKPMNQNKSFKQTRTLLNIETGKTQNYNKSSSIRTGGVVSATKKNSQFISEISESGANQDLTIEESRKLQFQMIQSEMEQQPLSQEQQIKKNIENMGIQDINRNTRFFKDYLKDQIKQQIKKKKREVEVANTSGIKRMFTRKFSGDSDTKPEDNHNDTLSKNLQQSLGTAIKFSQNEDRDHQRMLRNQKLLQQYNSMRNNNLAIPTQDNAQKFKRGRTVKASKLNQATAIMDLQANDPYLKERNNQALDGLPQQQPIRKHSQQQISNRDGNLSQQYQKHSAGNESHSVSSDAQHSRKQGLDRNQEGEYQEDVKDEEQNEENAEGFNDEEEDEEEASDRQQEKIKDHGLKRKQTSKQDSTKFIQEQLQEKDEEDLYEEQIIRLKNSEYNKWILHPESDIRTFIDGLSFVFLMIIAVYVPFMISFDVEPGINFQIFEVIMDIWFITEIVVNFFTGFYAKGSLVMNLNAITLNYVKGYLWIDCISSFPISFINLQSSLSSNQNHATAIQSAKFLRMIRLTRYLRLLRLLRFVQINRILSTFEVFLVSEMAHLTMKFLKICTVIIFLAHWIACIMFSMTQYDNPNEPKNWLHLQNLQDASPSEIYVNALYWVITTTCTVGYGDFHPVTTNERIVIIISMIFQSGLFAYIIGDISRTVSSFNRLASHFRERMNYVEKFLREKDIPVALRQQVKRYLEYNWELKKLYKIEETELLTLLNDNLRGKIIVYFNGRILQSIDVLGRFPIEFLSNLSFILQKRVYAIDDNCVMEGEIGQDIFFIVSGKVAVIDKKSKTHIQDLIQDQYFGEISFFSEIERQATVKARDFSEMLVLRRDDFLQMALKVSPPALDLFHQIKSQISKDTKNFKILLIKCYICSKKGHIAKNCTQFSKIRGNLKKYLKMIYNQSEDSLSTVNDVKKRSPIMVSLASSEDRQRPQYIEDLYNQENEHHTVRFNKQKKRPAHHHHLNHQQLLKQSIESHVTFKQSKYYDTNLANFVVLPKELQNEINKSDDEKNLDFSNIFNAHPQKVFLGESFDQTQGVAGVLKGGGRISQQKANQNMTESKTKNHQVTSPQSQIQGNIGDITQPLSTMNSKQLETKPTPEKINTLIFKTQLTSSEGGKIIRDVSESMISHLNKKPLITGEDLVILEDDNENYDDDVLNLQQRQQIQQIQNQQLQNVISDESLLSCYEMDSDKAQNLNLEEKKQYNKNNGNNNNASTTEVPDLIQTPDSAQKSPDAENGIQGIQPVKKQSRVSAGVLKNQQNELTAAVSKIEHHGSKNQRKNQILRQKRNAEGMLQRSRSEERQ